LETVKEIIKEHPFQASQIIEKYLAEKKESTKVNSIRKEKPLKKTTKKNNEYEMEM
jgi:3'-phosphoadenosine 5'-phosphosulfate sulfotransferase (PAPS reductase)/FAD synthetase